MEQRDTRNTVRGSTVKGPVYQADAIHFHGSGSRPEAELPADLAGVDWAHAVFHSAIWGHVAAGRPNPPPRSASRSPDRPNP